MNKSVLESAIDRQLAARGWRRRGSSWYAETTESISAINLQKSQWGGQFYLNIGLYYRALGDERFPEEHKLHLRGRLSSITEASRLDLDTVLDLEQPLPDEERTRSLEAAVLEVAVPYLEARSHLSEVARLSKAESLGPLVVSRGLRELIAHEFTP
jgi:hypothetical protein